MTAPRLNVVVLAAGKGTRMRSDLPKVLHRLAGRALAAHVFDAGRAAAQACGRTARIIGVHGHGGRAVPDALSADDVRWVVQEPQQGTGHAVMQALPELDDDAPTLVLYGDVPLTRPETLARLVAAAMGDEPGAVAGAGALRGGDASRLALLTVDLADPTGYGRIVREAPLPGDATTPELEPAFADRGRIRRIVEHKDASRAELGIREVNTGILVAPTRHLRGWLARLGNDNAQREYYLTDIVAMAVADRVPVVAAQPAAEWETLGVNDRLQLAQLERTHQREVADGLMRAGVQLADPARLDVRGRLSCGRDVFIDVGCVFEGTVELADGVSVGPYCVIRDARIEAGAQLAAYTHVDGARVGSDARIGPFARLRPGTDLDARTHVGNFVELKNTRMAADAKANHLAYVGDADVGQRVNIGAGTITCNYDGANKHRTVIEDDAFIGSDTQLVAPVTVGRGATLGAGTTLTKDAPPESLTISRAVQRTIPGWQRPVKQAKTQG